MKKYAVFSCKGLGDGLIALVLSNNLRLNGASVTTFHPFLNGLQAWFPYNAIRPFPSLQELNAYEVFFIIYEKSEWMQTILSHCKTHYPHQTIVLNPIATHHTDYPYWEVGKFEGKRTFVDNLLSFCRNELHLKLLTKDNGIRTPDTLIARRFPKRVVLHPSSSREGKNWPKEKFIALANALKRYQFEPVFVLDKTERKEWALSTIHSPFFESLEELGEFIYESGYMIGNDSGIGHLASCLGVPTMTLCRSYQSARFWRPAWARGKVIAPYKWIPNIKAARLRDRYWKKWVSVKRVLNHFLKLAE